MDEQSNEIYMCEMTVKDESAYIQNQINNIMHILRDIQDRQID